MYSITSAEDLLLYSKALYLYQQQLIPKIWIHLAAHNDSQGFFQNFGQGGSKWNSYWGGKVA